jgi:hypothetical protein
LAARGENREKLLLESDRLAVIVPRLPPEELLFTLRSVSREGAVDILSHARTAQVRFMLDLELWEGDRIKKDRAAHWLALLNDCPDKVLDRWAKTLDATDLWVLVAPLVRISLADKEGHPRSDDAPGETSFTPDGVHYFTVPDELADGFRRFLLLMGGTSEKFRDLLHLLLSGFDAEKEEAAYRMRAVRLAERGFVGFEEAQEIYAPLTPEKFAALPPRRAVRASGENGGELDAPPFPAVLSPAPVRLSSVLDRLARTEDAEALLVQVATLTHKVIAADGLDPGNPESYARAAFKTAGRLTIGLEVLCGADEEKMARTLGSHWVEHVFRLGAGQVDRVARAARAMVRKGWPQGKMERLLLLDSPLREVLNGILRKRPQWYCAGDKGFCDFSNLREVELAERSIAKAGFLGRYLIETVHFRLDDLGRAAHDIEEENLRASTIFLTALVNAALDRGFRFAPIPRAEAARGLALLWDRDDPPRRMKAEMAEAAMSWSTAQVEMTDEERRFLEEFISEAFSLLEEQFGNLPPGATPDPRFLAGLWIV